MTVGADVLGELLGDSNRTMWILTVSDGHDRSGCLMGFATQVSLVQDYRAHLDLLNEVAQAAAAVTAATGLPPHNIVRLE